MTDRISKTQRLLDLVAYLLGRRMPVTVEEILERVPAYTRALAEGDDRAMASTRRMFERDKDELRALGIPLESTDMWINYGSEKLEAYRIKHTNFYLPYLRLLSDGGSSGQVSQRAQADEVEFTDPEASIALDALRRVADQPAFPFAAEARSAFRKLAFDLDPQLFPGEPVLWIDPPGVDELLARVRALSEALIARKRVGFRYHGIHRGETSQRQVRGYGLFFSRDWYLIGHDEDRDALRMFRVARMESVSANPKAPKTPDYEVPDSFRLRDHINRDAWELAPEAEPMIADVLFRFPASLLAEQEGRGELVERLADGATVRRFSISQVDAFLRWVLSLEGEARILAPEELVSAMRQLSSRVAAIYSGEVRNG